MLELITQEEFDAAPPAASFLVCCGACGLPTGEAIIKSGDVELADAQPTGKYMLSEQARCEFCRFLAVWLHEEGINPEETGLKYGAAKVVTVEDDGAETFVAYVPFTSEDIETPHKLADGTPFNWQHGLTLEAEQNDGAADVEVSRVLRYGV